MKHKDIVRELNKEVNVGTNGSTSVPTHRSSEIQKIRSSHTLIVKIGEVLVGVRPDTEVSNRYLEVFWDCRPIHRDEANSKFTSPNFSRTTSEEFLACHQVKKALEKAVAENVNIFEELTDFSYIQYEDYGVEPL